MTLKAPDTKPDKETILQDIEKIKESSRNYRKLVDTPQKTMQKNRCGIRLESRLEIALYKNASSSLEA